MFTESPAPVQILRNARPATDLTSFMTYSHGSRTVNEAWLVRALEKIHGPLVTHDTEVYLHPGPVAGASCQAADLVGVVEDRGRQDIVGVEIKDWKARLTPSLARRYLATYVPPCNLFYLAGRNFSQGLTTDPQIGLIDLHRLQVIKPALRVDSDPGARSFLIQELESRVEVHLVKSEYQTCLDHWF